MTKITTDFHITPATRIYKQRISVKPIEHHYENQGEQPYIKYGCPICENIADKINKPVPYNIDGKIFNQFSIPKGEPNCPCCGINLDWTKEPLSYKNIIDNIDFSQIKKNEGIYEYPIKTINDTTLSLGISYEDVEDNVDHDILHETYIYNLFYDDTYINISTTGTPEQKYTDELLNELYDQTPDEYKYVI